MNPNPLYRPIGFFITRPSGRFFCAQLKGNEMSLKDTIASACEASPVTISSGTSMTAAINLGGLRLFGVVVPSDWTAANLTFQMSPDAGTTWVNLCDQDGDAIMAVANASSCVMVNPAQMAPLQYLRIRSGTVTTPVLQTADRVLQLMLRSV